MKTEELSAMDCAKCGLKIGNEWCNYSCIRDDEGDIYERVVHEKCPAPNPLLKQAA